MAEIALGLYELYCLYKAGKLAKDSAEFVHRCRTIYRRSHTKSIPNMRKAFKKNYGVDPGDEFISLVIRIGQSEGDGNI